MKSRLLAWSAFALIILLGIIVLYAIWLIAFDANPPTTFNNLPFPVDKAQYAPGDSIRMTMSSCRHTQAPSEAYMYLRGEDIIYTLPPVSGPGRETACATGTVPIATVPQNVEPGMYYIYGVTEYRVNVLVIRRVPWRSQSFRVVVPGD